MKCFISIWKRIRFRSRGRNEQQKGMTQYNPGLRGTAQTVRKGCSSNDKPDGIDPTRRRKMEQTEGRVFGYARVSSQEQNLDRQILALKEIVPEENILTDKASGKDLERPSYQALKGALGLRKGDTLVITSLDRLSRNKEDIQQELRWFREKGVRLKILDLPTSLIEIPDGQKWILDMIQNILIEVMASIAEQERITIRKRQREGIEAAKKKGRRFGRPPVEMPRRFEEVYWRWKRQEMTAAEAMHRLELSSSTFYRMVRRYERGHASKSP